MENSQKVIPSDFEEIKDDDLEDEDTISKIYKSENYDKIMPNLIKAINNNYPEKSKDTESTGEYPYFSPKHPVKYLPRLEEPSEILNDAQLKEIHIHLPYFRQYVSLNKLYSLSIDGTSIKTLYKKCEGIKNSILVVRDGDGNVFGAYVSEVLYPSAMFCGSPDSFLFTFYTGNKITIYKSTEINDHYVYCDNEQICFGNTDDDFSLCIQNNLTSGYSKETTTYNNQPLNDKDSFTVAKLEVWGFKER